MLPGASMSQEAGGPDPSFEERLKAARGKQGLDEPPRHSPGDQDGLDSSPMGIGLRVGVELVAALVVAVAIGYGIDWLFGTKTIFTVVFIPVGGAAGVWNVWRVFAPKSG